MELKRFFPKRTGRGGSYSTTYVCKAGWVVIENAWGKQTIIPESCVKRIEVESNRRW